MLNSFGSQTRVGYAIPDMYIIKNVFPYLLSPISSFSFFLLPSFSPLSPLHRKRTRPQQATLPALPLADSLFSPMHQERASERASDREKGRKTQDIPYFDLEERAGSSGWRVCVTRPDLRCHILRRGRAEEEGACFQRGWRRRNAEGSGSFWN